MMERNDTAAAWHTLGQEAVYAGLQCTDAGLAAEEAARRLQEYGPNELQPARRVPWWSILLEQFKSTLIVILLVACLLSAFLGHTIEAIAILAIVLFAAGLGFVQEYRAERAIEALMRMAAPMATVVRDGAETSVPARDVVPGDVILLHAGDKVPADARLVEVASLNADEAALTGESLPVEKQTAPLRSAEIAVGDRKNIVYAGTSVTYGRGRGVVVATGAETEFGRIAGMLESIETGRTPLQQSLERLGRTLARLALFVVALIIGLGLLRGQGFVDMLIFGIALAVAVVPEALPAIVTISLAIGVQRLVKRHALMRRLPAVETLGSTSVICSDKTGTLTRDEMTVRKVLAPGGLVDVSGTGYEPRGQFSADGRSVALSPALAETLRAAALATDAHVDQDDGAWRLKGDPTEGALVVAAAKAGLWKSDLESESPRIDEIPFTSERKRMTTLHEVRGRGVVAYCKGAPEVVVEACTMRVCDAHGNVCALDGTGRQAILGSARDMAAQALRVIAVASRTEASRENAEQDMTFLGLLGMIDPPRAEAKDALGTCRKAGIRVVMITGDHPVTARAVAEEIGLLQSGGLLTGTDVETMGGAELRQAVPATEVYARVSPQHKLRIVEALQSNGEIVAMTGDGVNDAPALKKADIGVAMGITGTDVSKEAAAMTLTDDNFASIVAAVEEGRGIFGNIKKYLMYLLSANVGEIGLVAGATVAGLPLPLTAVQILYVNLATDGLPALALSVDPAESDLMGRRPRDPKRSIFTRPVVALMVVGGLWSTLVNLGVFVSMLRAGRSLQAAMTMTFLTLVLIEFFKAYSFRSDRHSLLRQPFANRWLNLAICWESLLLALIVYVPFLSLAFGTVRPSPSEWLLVGCVALTVVPVLETAKWFVRRGWFGKLD
jgi:Ca2+-transporting ATPase